MKRFALFSLVCLTMVAVLAAVSVGIADGDAGRRAVLVSAAVAVVLQLVTFAVARRYAARNIIAAWGVGIAARFTALVVYGFIGASALGLRLDVALLSMAVFLFATTLVEPLFLKP